MELRDEYAVYTHVKALQDIFENDTFRWLKNEYYEVVEVWKADRIVEVESESGRVFIDLDDESFEFIEEE
ncbi:hypothetical protein X915_gp131 [Bacillus phage vB_BanS-Tsamsa]|uniref:Uncharacterized protein n=1 Tax=Bacillus phage vB_BanS-Tsamsa TaxID=1308863 RepID=U5J9Z9_9CAUD|nr:hypothetical protein X915_gp131 [Bacillus phage vB_BanS-Tsamsa]AGI11935.1 hypothetical protein [Bacillus phage vB_BanS-Tsamsa]